MSWMCCEIIKWELNEMKLQQSSCKEIIRVLQEEIRENSPPTESVLNIVNGDHSVKESYSSSVKDDWTNFSSNRRRKPQHTRRNLVQFNLQSSKSYLEKNKFL